MAKAKPINLEELEKLAGMFSTEEEIAAWFGMSRETFNRRKARSAEIREILERGQHKGRVSLRRAQMQRALAGDRTMLIWCGKQHLGQKDRIETTDTGGVLLAERLAQMRQRLQKHRDAEAARAEAAPAAAPK